MSWHPEDPRSWGGRPPHDPRWGRHQPTWGWGHPGRPLYDNQLGHRLPTGGPPAAGQLTMGVALALFLLSPVTLLAWAAGQALLRITGLRWWKLALASLAAIAAVIVVEGGPGPALAHHFSGYAGWLRQIGAAQLDYPAPGAFLWPQLPLAIPVGLLAAALNLAGRRQAIDPAEVKQATARGHPPHGVRPSRRAATVRDDHFGPVALGVQIDGDLGWTDKRGLVVVPRLMQNRSRLIVGTSGTGKTTDIEREAFRAARDGRKFFLIDGKGTDPGFVERALAGYLWGNPHARVALWPELPMDGWRGNPAALHNRLMAMLGWTEPYYKDVASLLLRLALNAPGEDGPVRSSGQLHGPDGPRAAGPAVRARPRPPPGSREPGRPRPGPRGQGRGGPVRQLLRRHRRRLRRRPGRAGRSRTSTSPTSAPPTWPAARTPTPACGCCWRTSPTTPPSASPGEARTPPSSSTSSRPSPGAARPPSSSSSGSGTPAAPSTCRAQSADGLGDEAQQRRLVGACSGGLLIHAMPDPETLLRAAGVVKVVEQTWRLDPQGPTGNSSARIGERPRIEPGAVQQAREGEAWYIARGRFEHLMVARTTISDGYRARAHAMVALARSWRPAGGLAGCSHLDRGPSGRPGRPERPAGPSGHRAATRQLGGRTCRRSRHGPAPAGHRLRLAVAAAARDGDQDATAALVREGPRPRRRGGRAGGGGRGPLAQARLAPSRLAGRAVAGRRPGCGGYIGLEAGRRWPNRSTGHDRSTRGCRRGTASPLRWPAGPCTHRPRPFACWTGCHLAPAPSRPLRYSLRSVPRVPPGWPAASLDRSGAESARRDPVARGGRGAAPDQQAGGEDRGGPRQGPPPPPAPADPPTRKEEQATDRTTTATNQPAAPRAPRRGQPCPTPTSPSPAT